MENKPISLYILSGFLGAGKTTFLKKMLELNLGKKIGIIMNEFGKESIDGMIIKDDKLDIKEINNGSIFCSCLKGSFTNALIDYQKLPIDLLLIEGSGLSDPSNMPEILNCVEKESSDRKYDYKGSICLVDALNFVDYYDAFVAIEKQIIYSDVVIINKIDLVDSIQLKEIENKIVDLNPLAAIIHTSFCDIDFEQIHMYLNDKTMRHARDTCNTPDQRPKTLILKAEGTFERIKLERFLKSLNNDAYRIKGFFQLKEGWHQIDVVGKQIHIHPTTLAVDTSKLVIISSIGIQIIKKIFSNWECNFDEKMVLR
jgi:G3E family GTPase